MYYLLIGQVIVGLCVGSHSFADQKKFQSKNYFTSTILAQISF